MISCITVSGLLAFHLETFLAMTDIKITEMPKIATAAPAADSSPAATQTKPDLLLLDSTTIETRAQPTPSQIITFMVQLAKVINRQVGVILANQTFTVVNPGAQGLIAAAASLEQGAAGLDQLLRQIAQQQAGIVMPGPGGLAGKGKFTN
jgi:hypothetical protein